MTNFCLTQNDKVTLLKQSKNTLCRTLNHPTMFQDIVNDDYSDNLLEKCGAFTSIYNNGKLRGCIGQFANNLPLIELIEHTTQAACHDSRFPSLKKSEIEELSLELSILTPLEEIISIDQIELGKHGIYIKKGVQSGTYLPQVALQSNWTIKEFVDHCSFYKARIGWNGWKNADLYRYEAIIIKESDFP